MKRWIYPVELEGVSLKVGALTWSRLPQKWKVRLVEGTHRIDQLRSKIADDAKVKSMPPVRVIGELWKTKNRRGIIDGMATPFKVQDHYAFGVVLPAPTIILEDEALLRAVLVHEFAHCFYAIFQIVKHQKMGIAVYEDRFEPLDKSEDDKRLGNPSDWFGVEDVRSLVGYQESRLQEPLALAYVELYGLLPEVTPDLRGQTNTVGFERDIFEHIQKLLLQN